MKILYLLLILIIIPINVFYCSRKKFKYEKNKNENQDMDISLIQISKEKLVEVLVSDRNIKQQEYTIDDLEMNSNADYEIKDKLLNLFENEIYDYITKFHIKNEKLNEKKDFNYSVDDYYNRITYTLKNRIDNNAIVNLNKDSFTENKMKYIIAEEQDKKQIDIIKKLSRKILGKLICKNKKRILIDLLDSNIQEFKITQKKQNFKNKEQVNATKALNLIFSNESINGEFKDKLIKEIGILIRKSKEPEKLLNYTKENLNELNEIINKSLFCPNYCSLNGYCLEGKCFCKPGFKGLDCSIRQKFIDCPNNCFDDNGVCNEDGYCICKSGFSGIDCSIKRNLINYLNFIKYAIKN